MVKDWWQKWFGSKFLKRDQVIRHWSRKGNSEQSGFYSESFRLYKHLETNAEFSFLCKQLLHKIHLIRRIKIVFSERTFSTKSIWFRIFIFCQKGNSERTRIYAEFFAIFSNRNSEQNHFSKNQNCAFSLDKGENRFVGFQKHMYVYRSHMFMDLLNVKQQPILPHVGTKRAKAIPSEKLTFCQVS